MKRKAQGGRLPRHKRKGYKKANPMPEPEKARPEEVCEPVSSISKKAEESEELILVDSSEDEELITQGGHQPERSMEAGEFLQSSACVGEIAAIDDGRIPSSSERDDPQEFRYSGTSGASTVKSSSGQPPEDPMADEETPAPDATNLDIDDVSVLIACHRACSIDGAADVTESTSTLLDSFPSKVQVVDPLLDAQADVVWGTDSSVIEGISSSDSSLASQADELSSVANVEDTKQVFSEPIIAVQDPLGASDTSSNTTLTIPSCNISDMPGKNEATSFLSEAALLPPAEGGENVAAREGVVVLPSQIVTTEEYLESEPSISAASELSKRVDDESPIAEEALAQSSATSDTSPIADSHDCYPSVSEGGAETSNSAVPQVTPPPPPLTSPKVPLFRQSAASTWSDMDRTPTVKVTARLPIIEPVREELVRHDLNVLPRYVRPSLTLPAAAFSSAPMMQQTTSSIIHPPTVTYLPSLTTYQTIRQVPMNLGLPSNLLSNYQSNLPSGLPSYTYINSKPEVIRPATISWQGPGNSFSMATSPLKHLKELREHGLSPSIHFQPTANTTYYSALPDALARGYTTYAEPRRQYFTAAAPFQRTQLASMVTSRPSTYYATKTMPAVTQVASMTRDWTTTMSAPDSARTSTADQLLAHKPPIPRTDRPVRESTMSSQQMDSGISSISRCRRGRRLLFGSPLR